MKNIKKNKSYIQLNLVDKQSIRDFKKNGDLLKWIHNNGVMNVSNFLFIFKKIKTVTSQARFRCTDDKLVNLVKYLQEFKSSVEFTNCYSNADKVKLYESVRKSLAEIHEDEPEAFGSASVSENHIKI